MNSSQGSSFKQMVSIVIPSYKRHNYLCRTLDYYKDSGIRVIVGDGSPTAFPDKDKFQCDYFHFPNMPIHQRWQEIINKVDTPYMVFGSDDDFIVPFSILKCVQFLEENKLYATAEGKYIKFSNNTLRSYPFTPYPVDEYSNSDLNKHLHHFFYDIVNCYYSVHRKENIMSMLSCINEYKIKEGFFIELILLFFSSISGGHKILPFLHAVRSDTERAVNTVESQISQKSENEEEKFKSLIIEYIMKRHKISQSAGGKIFNDSLYTFYNVCKTHNFHWYLRSCPGYKSNLGRKYFYRNFIFNILKKHFIARQSSIHYHFRRMLKKKQGYVYGKDRRSILEWRRIKKIVKKYRKIDTSQWIKEQLREIYTKIIGVLSITH